MMRRKWIGVLFLVAIVAPVQGQSSDAEARLLADLRFLTSDACEGRGITTKGIQLAAEHIEREFIKAGCAPGGTKGYYQPFTINTGAKAGKANAVVLKGALGQTITLTAERDFRTLPQGGTAKADAPIVFVGYGLTTPPAPPLSKGGIEGGYDDYSGLDVAERERDFVPSEGGACDDPLLCGDQWSTPRSQGSGH